MLKHTFEYFRILLRVFLWPVYWLSGLFPRDKSIWVFETTGKRFADNSKYLFLYASQNSRKGIRPVWISRSREIVGKLRQNGFEAYHLGTLKGLYFCLLGKIWISDTGPDDISFWLSRGARSVNLWHGIPLKKIGWDNLYSKWFYSYGIRRLILHTTSPWIYGKSEFYLAPSTFVVPLFKSAFKVGDDQILICSYPRNTIFGDKPHGYSLGCDALGDVMRQKEAGKKVIMYMPTFRDCATREHDSLDMHAMNEFLRKRNAVVVVKAHIYDSKPTDDPGLQNVITLRPEDDAYPCLALSDMLVTDYSSVYFDYLLTKKPIIFFCYDLADYLGKSRQMYFNYEEMTPGPKAVNYEELVSHIETTLNGHDNYKTERETLAKKVFSSSGDMKDLFNRLVDISEG